VIELNSIVTNVSFQSIQGGLVEAVAAEWRTLPPKSRAHWEEMAKAEKKRFSKEKVALCKTHNGPLARKIRAKKNPVSCFTFVDPAVFFLHQ
jgi:hypothetical protein